MCKGPLRWAGDQCTCPATCCRRNMQHPETFSLASRLTQAQAQTQAQTERERERHTDTHRHRHRHRHTHKSQRCLLSRAERQRGPHDRVTKGSRIAQISRGGADFRLPVARSMWLVRGSRFRLECIGIEVSDLPPCLPVLSIEQPPIDACSCQRTGD